MVFSSTLFLFLFLPTLLFVYCIAPQKLKNPVLLLFSLLFYAWGEPKNVFLMMLSILINYVLGRLIERFSRWKKLFLILAALYNLGMLFVFKYLNFAVGIWESLTKTGQGVAQIVLPIGISFYTPNPVLCDRRLPRRREGAAESVGLGTVYLLVSAAHRRPYRPLLGR